MAITTMVTTIMAIAITMATTIMAIGIAMAMVDVAAMAISRRI
jgi:hypothetical protein